MPAPHSAYWKGRLTLPPPPRHWPSQMPGCRLERPCAREPQVTSVYAFPAMGGYTLLQIWMLTPALHLYKLLVRMACTCLLADRSYDGAAFVMKPFCNMVLLPDSCAHAYLLMLTGNSSDKVKMLNMGQHILDSLDTPQQLYQVCYEFRSHVCRA